MNEFEKMMKPIMNNIYGFKIEGDKVKSPEVKLPDCVVERLNYFSPMQEDGLTFMGMMNLVFAYDEAKVKEDYWFGSYVDWLPVSDDFKAWRDSADRYFAEMEIAVAILYGYKGAADPEWLVKEKEKDNEVDWELFDIDLDNSTEDITKSQLQYEFVKFDGTPREFANELVKRYEWSGSMAEFAEAWASEVKK